MFVNVTGGDVSEKEQKVYIQRGAEKFGSALEGIEIEVEGDEVTLKYHICEQPFERIRRITGYLVGSLDKWNDAKQAEEKDRVKHVTGF